MEKRDEVSVGLGGRWTLHIRPWVFQWTWNRHGSQKKDLEISLTGNLGMPCIYVGSGWVSVVLFCFCRKVA